MIRGILVAVLLVGLVAAAVLGPRWLMRQSPDAGAADDAQPCDLAEAGHPGCQWQHDGEQWQVRVTELPSQQGLHRFQLDLQTTATPDRLHAILRGESMYLGEYPVVLKAGERPDHWQATFTAPLCTVQNVMVWRLDLQQRGQQALEGVPFKLIFSARSADAR